MNLSDNIKSILFWSVISAAFIGPGTVTTSAKAGSTYGLSLLWALLFSILATFVLQETAARIRMGSGMEMGDIFSKVKVPGGLSARWGVFISVFIGCAAYQAGNFLGGYSGLELLYPQNPVLIKVLMLIICILFLWKGTIRQIAQLLGIVVAIMSICYLILAIKAIGANPAIGSELNIVSIPKGSGLLVAGLIGTTIVPYNLFLGSGIAKGTDFKTMRIGLAGAIIMGGIISIAIMVASTMIPPDFSFQKMYEVFHYKGHPLMAFIAAAGLFAAGLSSAITCPLAAALAGEILIGSKITSFKRGNRSFHLVWLVVIAIGGGFMLFDSKPVPAIIAAQAINGILLPVVAIFLVWMANDKRILPANLRNKLWQNILSILILITIVWLGVNSLISVVLRFYV